MERILKLITDANVSDYSLEKTLGFTQGTISNWRRNKNKISTDAVIKLAKYFNVSTDYLLCLTDEPNYLSTNANTSTELIKRPKYDVSDKFKEDYMNLLKDKHFSNIAKVYNEFDEENQLQIYTYIVTLATKVGLNVAKIIE